MLVLYLVQGCGCSCPPIPKPNTSDYTVTTSSVIIYGDACAPSDGSTASEGKSYSSATPVPNAQCDNWSGGSYGNRGRWVMVPPPQSSTGGGNSGGLSVSSNSTVTITTYGTVYYCSSGYDNYHVSPYIPVFPGQPANTFFSDGSQLSISEGEIIILNIGDPSSGCAFTPSNSFCNPGTGVTIGSTGNVALDLPACDGTQYSDFVNGTCRATGGFGLTIYSGDKIEATLDEQNYSGNSESYIYSTSRTPNLYAPLVSSSQQTSFFNTVETNYSEDISLAGPIQYVYKSTANGVFGVSIAEEARSNAGGSGQYNVTVLTAPASCEVSNSQATTEDNRGAVQLLFEPSGTNPNTVDDVITTFNNYDPNLTIYYPELMKYLAQDTGTTIQSDAEALSSLLVPSTGTNDQGQPNYNPYVFTSQVSTVNANSSGYIWLKVKDDYYHDNVGAYQVQVQVQTPNESQVSAFLDSLITPINDALVQSTLIIYQSFFSVSNNFTAIIHMSLMLYVMVFGGQFLLGLSTFSLQDTFIRIFKIAVMNELLQPSSWDFYNQYFFNIYTQGQSFLIGAVTGDTSSDYSGVFGFVDDVFNIFFSTYTWQQLAALLPSIMGFLYATILIVIMLIYLMALTQVFMVYLLAMVGLYLLIALAPMFMVTLLFERTKKIFMGWIKYLFSFAIQPVILFAVLYFVNEIFMTFWENAMSFNICWGNAWELYFYGVYIWTFNVVQPFTIGCVWYYVVTDPVPIYQMFAEVMMLYFFVLNTQAIISFAPKISDAISGTSGAATSLVKIGSGMINSASSLVLGDPVKKAQKIDDLERKRNAELKTNKKLDKWGDYLKGSKRQNTTNKNSNDSPNKNQQTSSHAKASSSDSASKNQTPSSDASNPSHDPNEGKK